MSPAASRRKGVTGERALADLWRAAGWTLRGLEGAGDWLAIRPALYSTVTRGPVTLHLECKRQERLRTAWLDQARAEAPPGVPWVVAWRPNRGEWVAMLPLQDLLELIG